MKFLKESIWKLAYWLLLIVVFTIPAEYALTLPGVGTLCRGIGMCALCVGLTAVWLRGTVRPLPTTYLILVLFVTLSMFSFFWSLDRYETWSRVPTLLQLLTLTWLVWEFGDDRAKFSGMLQAYILGTVVVIVMLVWNLHSGSTFYGSERISGSGFDPNYEGVHIAMAIPMAWYVQSRQRNLWSAFFYRLFIPLAVFGVVVTGSRGALITSTIGLAAVFLGFRYTRLAGKLMLVVAVIIACFCISKYAPESSMERFSNMGYEITEGTMTGRKTLWKASMKVVDRHLIAGVGAGASRAGMRRIVKQGYETHSTLLQVAVELGGLGIGVLFVLFIALMVRAYRLSGTDRLHACVLLSTWIAGSVSLSMCYMKSTWILFGLLIAQGSFFGEDKPGVCLIERTDASAGRRMVCGE